MKFLLDHDVPADLSYLLQELAHEVIFLRKVLPEDAADESVLQFAHKSAADLSTLLRENRVMFLEGVVDLPSDMHLSGLFDTIEFDWRIIARRIVSDLIGNRYANAVQEQTVFKAKWCPGIGREIVPF